MLQEGQIINNVYTVERMLGEGAFAKVYRVNHRVMGRKAMKVFKAVGLKIEDIWKMLEEASTLSQFQHRNIIQVSDANIFELDGALRGYFTMEYIAGGALDRFLNSQNGKFMPMEDAVDIIRQITRGLSVAHSQNPPIVHRDIKPQNILTMMDRDGRRVVISDFGLAKRANPLTLLVSAQGTRIFKSPETFEDRLSDSCAGDVWAIGCTLYLTLTYNFPFVDPGDHDLVDRSTFKRPLLPPSHFNPMVDHSLNEITMRCLAINPKERYQNAMELLKALEQWKHLPSNEDSISIKSTSTNALKGVSSLNKLKAEEMAQQALLLAKHHDKLSEAADLMEEACNKWPDMREEYDYQIMLWRKGIIQ